MKRKLISGLLMLICCFQLSSQRNEVEWRQLDLQKIPPQARPVFDKIFCGTGGSVILSSNAGLMKYLGFRLNLPSISVMGRGDIPMQNFTSREPHAEPGIQGICQGAGSEFFFISDSGEVYMMDERFLDLTGWSNPPLKIPLPLEENEKINLIWTDKHDNLYAAGDSGNLFMVSGISSFSSADGKLNEQGDFSSPALRKKIRSYTLPGFRGLSGFLENPDDSGSVIIATNRGLVSLKKQSGETILLGGGWDSDIMTKGILRDKKGNIWFGTDSRGLGQFNLTEKKYVFSWVKNSVPVEIFLHRSADDFFISYAGQSPGLFNAVNRSFTIFTDTLFQQTPGKITDMKVDGFGNLFVAKDGHLYYTNAFRDEKIPEKVKLDSSAYKPFIYKFFINNQPYNEVVKNSKALPFLKEIKLRHNQNLLGFACSVIEYWDKEQTELACKLEGLNMDWVNMIGNEGDRFTAGFLPPLSPGKYTLMVRSRISEGEWGAGQDVLNIFIKPPFWSTWWFWSLLGLVLAGLFILFYRRHILSIRKKEREKIIHEKELLELEAKALRAQMNPHFIFNSLNSIKSLINKNENDAAAGYLITFSKLVRTLLENSDKREVSLHEEMETCKLYTQLEKVRFGDKVDFLFDIDQRIDLKDIKVPALVLQPFIENAIWHGLIPKKDGGKLTISLRKQENALQCIIDDDGIGRAASEKQKPKYRADYHSKGIGLTQSRLELDKLLNEREGSIHITDKMDEVGHPSGTRVIITFKEII